MGHCGGGPGPINIGAASQKDMPPNDTLQPPVFDAKHDMILALIEWTEKGKAPDEMIGTKFVDDLKASGIKFQRKLCPWPQVCSDDFFFFSSFPRCCFISPILLLIFTG